MAKKLKECYGCYQMHAFCTDIFFPLEKPMHLHWFLLDIETNDSDVIGI